MTQPDAIIAYLKAGNSLTGLDALRLFGTMKLATRISEIRRDNPALDIRDEWLHLPNGKLIKKYWIHRPDPPKDLFLSESATAEHEMIKK